VDQTNSRTNLDSEKRQKTERQGLMIVQIAFQKYQKAFICGIVYYWQSIAFQKIFGLVFSRLGLN